jgi:hypothetical protein
VTIPEKEENDHDRRCGSEMIVVGDHSRLLIVVADVGGRGL